MPVKKKIKEVEKTDSYFILSFEKKKKILGIFALVIAVLIFLSIISYSRYDQANLTYQFTDLFRVFSPDEGFAKRAESTHNWLGVFGAYLSTFFVTGTLGYFSLVFPVIIFLWGYIILKRNKNIKWAINISNFLLVTGIILASFFGVLRLKLNIFPEIYELSGGVGGYLGLALGRLLGGFGSILLLAMLLLFTLIIAIDFKLSRVIDFLKSLFEKSQEYVVDNKEVKTESNLEKIKELKTEKPKRTKFVKPETVEEVPEESIEGTKIQIVRSSEVGVIKEQEEEISEPPKAEQVKKEEKKKSEQPALPEIDKDEEAKLPNQWDEIINYKKPTLALLDSAPEENYKVAEEELKKNAELLKEKLSLFDIKIENITVTPGPVVTLYEIVPEPGVKISRIVSLEHDIALALAARGIRIIAPIPGKSAIGVEIPNAQAALVNARSVLGKINEVKDELPMALGKTISGDVYITDLSKMPHLLIAGSTGSGKSVGINMIITSFLYAKDPSDVKFVIIDPKKIELSFYGKLNKHFLAVSPDLDEEIITTPQNAILILKSVEYEMEKRYNRLAKAGVRNIVDYNQKVSDPKKKPKDTEDVQHYKMPYIIVIIDELADLMITASKEVEEPIARLAQLARAVGIHLVLATQRPSVNVITGVIKANFSARMAYQVATKIDSRTILDMNGAEQLLGRGDMLFLPSGTPKPIRMQNAFISTEEVEKITNYIYSQPGYSKRYFLPSMYEKKKESAGGFLSDRDPMFDEAARVIVRHQQGSVSLLQRRLKLGYSRAARIVDQLEEAGIVGPADGSKVRSVQVEDEQQLETILRAL